MDLKLENLTKRFGSKLAVEIPSLVIHSGEFFTFVGPSGCGKSTTLNLIAGLEEPTAGAVHLGDRDLALLPPHQRDVAFVFQSYALYPHRTVFGNLAFPLELARLPRPEVRRRVEEAAARLNLTPLMSKYPRQLSGGERQRVALGRAMVRQPQLFLFDEPLSNLDAPLRARMRKELKRLQRQLGTTFVYVTHDQEEALSLSDRIGVMQGGRVHQCGTPREVYDQPANTFVASFFGSPPINLLEGRLEAGLLTVGEFQLSAENLRAAGVPNGPISIGVRPEHVRIHSQPGPGRWPATVTLVETHGSQAHVELEAGALRLTAVADAGMAPAADQEVSLEVLPEKLHFFDLSTNRRLSPDSQDKKTFDR